MSKQTDDRFSFDISNTQSNRIEHLVSKALSEITEFGHSRYEAKQDLYKKGLSSSHEIGQNMGIPSFSSYKTDKSSAIVFTKYCFTEYNIKHLNQIKPDMIKNFLSEAVERGYARKTCEKYVNGIEKFAIAIDKQSPLATPRADTWYEATQSCKEMINNDTPEKNLTTRAYNNPEAIVNAVSDDKLRLCAEMQLNHGLRLADATKINDINGNILTVHNSKGGQDLQIKLTDNELQRIKEVSGGSMVINVKQSTYRDALHNACTATGQYWNGTHGLRHNFAQDRMHELTESGMNYKSALATVSAEMGHHRPSITEVYLR